MALLFHEASWDGWNLRHLLPLGFPTRRHLLDRGGQGRTTVQTPLRQDGPDLIHLLGGEQRPMRSTMARWPARFSSTLLPPTPLAGFSG